VRIGCDIGGTFTDVVAEMADGTLYINKTSTTPDDPGRAVVGAIREILAITGVAAAEVTEIVHGTTTASIERGSHAGYDAVWLDGAGQANVVASAGDAVVAAGGRLVLESADGRYRVYVLAKGRTDERSQEAGR
jgi:hypothetical protein